MNESARENILPCGLTELDVGMLESVRRSMRSLHLTGEFCSFTHPWEGEAAEEAIAHAEYLLGVLKPELNERLYGFSEVAPDD